MREIVLRKNSKAACYVLVRGFAGRVLFKIRVINMNQETSPPRLDAFFCSFAFGEDCD